MTAQDYEKASMAITNIKIHMLIDDDPQDAVDALLQAKCFMELAVMQCNLAARACRKRDKHNPDGIDPHGEFGVDFIERLAGLHAADVRPILDLFNLTDCKLIVSRDGLLTGETYQGTTLPTVEFDGHEYAMYAGA